jgi:hypothetical protein
LRLGAGWPPLALLRGERMILAVEPNAV